MFGLLVLTTIVMPSLFVRQVSAASPCANSRVANVGTTESADGSVVYGSECGDLIVATSPNVRRVLAGGGDDDIFANPNVEVVDGGVGNDAIHGDLPEESSAEEAPAGGSSSAWANRSPIASISITEKKCEANKSCYGGDGSQELI